MSVQEEGGPGQPSLGGGLSPYAGRMGKCLIQIESTGGRGCFEPCHSQALLGYGVHLVEEKVFSHFSDEVKKNGKRWVLDSGASNHMTDVREVFAELDTNIHGTVRFGDGSVVEIEGIGTILFVCRNGEHKVLVCVYLIPKLSTNIVSLGQLDEIGYEVLIKNGVMKVWDEHQKLLAKVERSQNQLYVLNMEIAQPVNLVVKGAEGAWLWHARFRHLNFRAPWTLTQHELVIGLPGI
jgi:hypothetical protein